ncbi:MAG: hypothetical protein Q8P56_00895 [Candidatus Uhrbacteria bacterium]|nr:hypothetical protein [Candidatus Uhrbacteria bacterium]
MNPPVEKFKASRQDGLNKVVNAASFTNKQTLHRIAVCGAIPYRAKNLLEMAGNHLDYLLD